MEDRYIKIRHVKVGALAFEGLFTVEVLLAGNYLPSSHPVKGAPLRCASLRDDALDWVPGFRKEIPLMKHFNRSIFAHSLISDPDTLDIIIESVG